MEKEKGDVLKDRKRLEWSTVNNREGKKEIPAEREDWNGSLLTENGRRRCPER